MRLGVLGLRVNSAAILHVRSGVRHEWQVGEGCRKEDAGG